MRIGQIVIDVAPLRESRDFRWLYTGRFVASAGNVVATTAANWQVYTLTHSPLAVGLLSLTSSIGMLVSLLAGGVLADRYDRRRLLMATGLPQVLLAGALMANSLVRHPAVWAIYAVTLAIGLLAGIGAPASTAATPALVGPARLPAAAALNGMGGQLGNLAGPALAGLLTAAPGFGAMVGAASSGWTGRVRRPGVVVIAAGIVWGGAIVGFGLTRSLPVALAFLALAGGGDMISEILRNALLQIYAPERLRGRLSSLYLAQVNTAPALGNTEAGIVAQLFSLTASVVSGGLACVGGALLLGALFPALRHATLAGPGAEGAPGGPPVPEPAD